jgi:hypothetical protein
MKITNLNIEELISDEFTKKLFTGEGIQVVSELSDYTNDKGTFYCQIFKAPTLEKLKDMVKEIFNSNQKAYCEKGVSFTIGGKQIPEEFKDSVKYIFFGHDMKGSRKLRKEEYLNNMNGKIEIQYLSDIGLIYGKK